MKNNLVLVALLAGTMFSFAQKKELRAVSKALKGDNFTEAQSLLDGMEGMLGSADQDQQADYYLYRAQAYFQNGNTNESEDLIGAAKAIKKANELGADPGDTSELTNAIRTAIVNSAVADQSAKNYEMAAQKLEAMYRVNPSDTSFLYFAASNLVSGNKYDKAVEYYRELQDLGYTGITQRYAATDAETGELKDDFQNVQERDLYVKSGAYINPTIIKSESKAPEIAKNIALIYVSLGKTEEAIEAIGNARKMDPNDTSLLMTEADIQYKAGNMDRFKEIMNEASAQDPKNPELKYNLGVVYANAGETEAAMDYYKQAIALRPAYPQANMNMASIILSGEAAIVEEMNSLGTSSADNRRYDELIEQRSQLYRDAIPYLQAARSETEDVEIVRTLMNIYSVLGETDKFKEMKSKLEELGG